MRPITTYQPANQVKLQVEFHLFFETMKWSHFSATVKVIQIITPLGKGKRRTMSLNRVRNCKDMVICKRQGPGCGSLLLVTPEVQLFTRIEPWLHLHSSQKGSQFLPVYLRRALRSAGTWLYRLCSLLPPASQQPLFLHQCLPQVTLSHTGAAKRDKGCATPPRPCETLTWSQQLSSIGSSAKKKWKAQSGLLRKHLIGQIPEYL